MNQRIIHDLFYLLILNNCLSLSQTVSEPCSGNDHHTCLSSTSHKVEPGPENELFNQCSPWKNVSCCRYNTTKNVHDLNMYNFKFDHCSQKRSMSPECKKHFVQDLCFYQCSPNIGPWKQALNKEHSKERFFGVPLCRSECDEWFSSCADDYTCTDNWAQNFVWENSTNHCPPEAGCATFRKIFKTPENFCEKVWDGSWKVVDDAEPCMKIWFDGSKGNPNDAVARAKLCEMSHVKSIGSCSTISTATFVTALLAMAVWNQLS